MRVRLAFIGLLASVTAWAAPLAPGAPWPALTLPDQHDKPVTLVADTPRVILFAAERKPGDWAQEVVDKSFQEVARAGRLVLVFDISRMPALVTKMFALPGFRARPFPILLAREPARVDFLPRQSEAVTVLTLEAGQVLAIDYARDAAALEAMLNRQFYQPPQLKEKS